jgi:hypothetical protein
MSVAQGSLVGRDLLSVADLSADEVGREVEEVALLTFLHHQLVAEGRLPVGKRERIGRGDRLGGGHALTVHTRTLIRVIA